MEKIPFLISSVAVFLLVDFYVIKGLPSLAKKWQFLNKKNVVKGYYILSALLLVGAILASIIEIKFQIRLAVLVYFFVVFLFKVCFAIFLLIDDLRRVALYFIQSKKQKSPLVQSKEDSPFDIPRSEFLLKAGLLAGAVPLAALRLNMKSGLYDYEVRRLKLYLPNLPKAFDGLKLAQISDIHSGCFYDKKAVLGGVEMLIKEKVDLIFFTGDLVNDNVDEMGDYQDVFSKIKAPLGVFSILGNHDYGDYGYPVESSAKKKNHDDLIATHKNMGWNLLLNENRRIKVDNEEIGILGVENWGAFNNFPNYGRMDLTVKNTDDLPVKLLLSHDPSHWRAQVLPQYPQIDAMFSGHTHGMQLGVRTKNFQWSPIKHIYNEWAGLYNEGPRQIYVNVGYGFTGVEGRVGILPEITIFELKSGSAPPAKT